MMRVLGLKKDMMGFRLDMKFFKNPLATIKDVLIEALDLGAEGWSAERLEDEFINWVSKALQDRT